MQIKRTMALILAALLASSAVACGSGDTKESGKTTEKDSTPVSSDETETAKETTPYEALGEKDFEGQNVHDSRRKPRGYSGEYPGGRNERRGRE